MRHTDVAVVGGGLAGSTAAAMLGRAGVETVLIDPNPTIRPDFRCEKFDAGQLEVLNRTGLAEVAAGAATRADTLWVARYGRLLDRKPDAQWYFRYEAMVEALRAEAGSHVEVVQTKARNIVAAGERQEVELADGEAVSARLVVLANGLNPRLRQPLGIEKHVLSAAHSISVGFDMAPAGGADFPFPALTYYPEEPASRGAYIALFPIGGAMRANLFVYRDLDDPWFAELRADPEETLGRLMPGLPAMTGPFKVTSQVRVRPVDLHVVTGHRRSGVVLVGDAFSTSCPAAGTGAGKALNDVERLCNAHIPAWLASPGMGADKIAQFYDDPAKLAYEAFSRNKAFGLKSLSLEPGLRWRSRRWVKFFGHLGLGAVRQARGRWSAPAGAPAPAAQEGAQPL